MLLFFVWAQTAEAAGRKTAKAAVDPIGQSENYSAVLYDNTNGLPTSEANAIAQTSEGFLWIGSYSGLIRYDGNTFERMDSSLGIGSVVSLYVDEGDRLWIGTNESGLLLMDRGELRKWGEEDGLGSARVCTIEEAEDGTVYVGTTSGITMISPDLSLKAIDDPRIANAYIEHISLGSDGLLYCITNEDDYFTIKDGRMLDYEGHYESSIQGITCILPDLKDPGKIFVGTGDQVIYYGEPTFDQDTMKAIDVAPLTDVLDIQQTGDLLWICARNGIGVVDEQGFHHLDTLPMDNSVSTMMEDYEGNLWFISARQGVMKMVPNHFSDVFTRCGLEPRVVNTTCMYEGKLFVGTDTGLIVIDGDDPVSSVPLTAVKLGNTITDTTPGDLIKMLDGCRIRSFILDSRGRMWISTWRACGLLCYDKGEVTAFTEAEGLFSDHIRTVCETTDGRILVVNTGGITVIEDGRVTGSYSKKDGIDNPEILTAAAAPNGDIVLGSNGAGIYVINGEGTRRIDKKDGLSSGVVMRIKHDPERGVFWLVTSNSLSYMTEDYEVITIQKFPYSNNFDLYENSKGDMWVLSSNGIYVLPSEELIANEEINPVHYGIANGLPCITTSNSYSELTEEGDLYIAGNAGVIKVNIEAPLENINELKQAVPYLDADGVRLYPDEKGGFTVPARVRKLTVYSYVFNYSLTDPQVSYCLEGFDREPVTVSRKELAPVSYTNLPGGSYQFVMELKDAMGRGDKKLSVPIVKEKALYEQVWFYVLSGLGAALVIFLLIREYVRRKMQAIVEKHRKEAEEERIASELHMANRIQVSMLPHVFPPFPERKEFDLYAIMNAAREVGGDFYDFYLVDDDHLCILIADVSGKGIPASLFMMISKAILQSCAMLSQSAAEILTKANEAICSNNQADMFVTVWLGILEISTGKVTAANAGHEYPAVMQNGRYSLMRDQHGLVLGGMADAKYKEYEFTLSPGDKLFVYTDGVAEATDEDEQMFGTDRMLEALNKEPEAGPEQTLRNVRLAVNEFVKDAEQFDDLTMLCLEYKGKDQ